MSSNVPAELVQRLRDAAKDALAVQSACNLSGVVHAFSRHMHTLFELSHVLGHGTDWINRHPVCHLFSTQIAFLSGTSPIGSHNHEAWVHAHEYCEHITADPPTPFDFDYQTTLPTTNQKRTVSNG